MKNKIYCIYIFNSFYENEMLQFYLQLLFNCYYLIANEYLLIILTNHHIL